MKDDLVRNEFKVHLLNEKGKLLAKELAEAFSELLNNVESICGNASRNTRELALVRTKLEEASFYAKRAMASNPEHQE